MKQVRTWLLVQKTSKKILKEMRAVSYRFRKTVFQEVGTASCMVHAEYFIKKTQESSSLTSTLIDVQIGGEGD